MSHALKAVKEFITREAVYTTSPGKTPSDRDTIEYFLKESKKGYCTYFASAATILLRSVGVPARYVEGLYVSKEELADCTENQELEIPDYDAHAWVEVYSDKYGFTTFEATPGRGEQDDTANSDSDSGNVEGGDNGENNNTENNKIQNTKNTSLKNKPLQEHKNHSKNSNLSKILLESRDLIKKQKLKQAYLLLKQTISTGIQHSDLFYLFGEINRMLKQNEEAEKFLIKSIKFELHSPYAFFSLGLLYQDMNQFQNSTKFFRLFNRLLDNADVHFQIAINYFKLKDFVNAAEEVSKAIDLNGECAEYYLFRSEIYRNMGLKEMENEDDYMNVKRIIIQIRR